MTPRFDVSLLPPAPTFEFEIALWERGCCYVAGVDEAGRGALAGPVAAGVVMFPDDPGLLPELVGVRDSKQMTHSERAMWAERLKQLALTWAVGFASVEEIDSLGIVPATRLAARRATRALGEQPEHLLVDFLELPELPIPQTPLVKGDRRSLSIAAASILAKTERDGLLCELEARYPGYGLAQHKGYATQAHRDALRRLGPAPIHRHSFSPVSSLSPLAPLPGGSGEKTKT